METHATPLPSPWSGRVTTGGLIIAGHIALFALIALNPVQYLRPAAKETVVMMVPPTLPKPEIRTVKFDKPIKQNAPLPAPIIPDIPLHTESVNSITVAQVAPELAPPTTPAPVVATPAVAKVDTGPKVVSAVEYIQAPQADYPAIARRLGEEGRVVMQVLVNDKGRAEKVEILKSSGFSRLDESAKLALLRALFKPYLEDGKPLPMLATASINFSLRG